MKKKWFEMKEQAAGEKRLLLLWYIYKIFGKKAVQCITFFVTLCAFLSAKEIRMFSKKNLKVIYDYSKQTNHKAERIPPTTFNSFKNAFSYSLSLIDKMEVFTENFDPKNIEFFSSEDKDKLFTDLKQNHGIFFICSHLGNIDIMRALLKNHDETADVKVNVFLSKNQCTVFNGFLNRISLKSPVEAYPVEEIGIETAIELKGKLENGETAFMAGDRVSSGTSNLTFAAKLFSKRAEFPSGTFKIAELMQTPIYFVCALKGKKGKYQIHLKRFNSQTLQDMQKEFVDFLEEKTLLCPLQFYHFYDLFEE